MLARLKTWWKAEIRGFGPDLHGPVDPDRSAWSIWYVRITPFFGFAIPWTRGRRLRYARPHGLQLVEWRSNGRWVVSRQLLGTSTVRGEAILPGARKG